jgi:hypothetical protein
MALTSWDDPRISLFKMKALQAGYKPDEIDALLEAKLGPSQEKQMQLSQDKMSLQQQGLNLQEAQQTPEQKGQAAAQQEIIKQQTLEKAGYGASKESDSERAAKEKARIAGDKAKNIINFVNEESKTKTYGDSLGGILKAGGASIPLLGQYIDPAAQNWEEGRLGIAIQIATQVLGAEKRVSDKEAGAYLANIPSIWDTEKKRTERIRKLRTRINADLQAQGLTPMNESSKQKLEDIFK